MSHQVSLFILNVEDFSIEDIERVSGGFNLNLDKTSKTYREKLFLSLFVISFLLNTLIFQG